jgi:hypothetical protein
MFSDSFQYIQFIPFGAMLCCLNLLIEAWNKTCAQSHCATRQPLRNKIRCFYFLPIPSVAKYVIFWF